MSIIVNNVHKGKWGTAIKNSHCLLKHQAKQRQARHRACRSPQQKFQSKIELGPATAGTREVQRFAPQSWWFAAFGLACQLIVGGTVLAAKLRAVIYNTTSDHLPVVACPACRKP